MNVKVLDELNSFAGYISSQARFRDEVQSPHFVRSLIHSANGF